MAQLIWSQEARRRLIVIAQYMQEVAPEQTDAVIDRLIGSGDRLLEFPRLGRPTTLEEEPAARELIVDRFHIIYKTDGDVVEISTVLHGAMDIQTRLHELFGEP